MFNPVPTAETALYLEVDSHHVSFINYIFLVNSSKSDIKTEQCKCVFCKCRLSLKVGYLSVSWQCTVVNAVTDGVRSGYMR